MMKKWSALFLAFFCFLTTLSLPVSADQIAVVSDIEAYIDYSPIASYNIDGYTYVAVEDLSSYGFDVVWSPEERALHVTRRRLDTPMLTREDWQRQKGLAVGMQFRIYPSDIRVDLDGWEIGSCNLDGRTLICIEDLGLYGTFKWNDMEWYILPRRVSVTIFENELQKDFDDAEDKVSLSEYPGELGNRKFGSYIGQINAQGRPDGIGRLYTTYHDSDSGPDYKGGSTYLGYFQNGFLFGKVHKSHSEVISKNWIWNDYDFIGEIRGTVPYNGETIEEPVTGLGAYSLPAYPYNGYLTRRLFNADFCCYQSGLYAVEHKNQGVEGASFRTWFDGVDFQTAIETTAINSRFINDPWKKMFREHWNGTLMFEDEIILSAD